MHMQLAEFPAMLDCFLSTPEALIGVEGGGGGYSHDVHGGLQRSSTIYKVK